MKLIAVKLRKNPYSIYTAPNLLEKIPAYVKRLEIGNFGLVITSPKVFSLHKTRIKKVFGGKNYKIITVTDGEKAKSRKWLTYLIQEILKADTLNRMIFLLCLGGGTIGDLTGFAASIYKRGIPYVQIPTTLLAQIDSAIGGKTAIDLKEAKNILGTFYQPKAVFIDPTFLKTLPVRELKQGLAEAIKYGVIADENFFNFLRQNYRKILRRNPDCVLKLISVCAGIKAKIVVADERESKGLRTILNFGHTMAHALESSLKYRRFSHGEAVALGMLYAAYLSQVLKKSSKQEFSRLREIIKLFGLPDRIGFNYVNLYKSLTYDKKFASGKIRMVLIRKIGRVEVVEGISPLVIKKTLKIFGRR
jgi:3-dehydroquinate synthase